MERGRGGPFGQVRAGEGAAVGWAFTYFFCLIGSFYVLRPIREEMGIRGGVDQLQWSFTATFLVMLVAVPVYSALVARVPRARGADRLRLLRGLPRRLPPFRRNSRGQY